MPRVAAYELKCAYCGATIPGVAIVGGVSLYESGEALTSLHFCNLECSPRYVNDNLQAG
jgi:hypothetical protein